MTPERAKELLPIIQAYAEGKNIQYCYHNDPLGLWCDISRPSWEEGCEYRIKPEPKVIYVNEFDEFIDFDFFPSKEDAEMQKYPGAEPIRIAVKYIEASD